MKFQGIFYLLLAIQAHAQDYLGRGNFTIESQGTYEFLLLVNSPDGNSAEKVESGFSLDGKWTGGTVVGAPNSSCKDDLQCRMPDGRYLVTAFCLRINDFKCRSWKEVRESVPRGKFPVDYAGGILFLIFSLPGSEGFNSKFHIVQRLTSREAKFDGDRIPEKEISWGNLQWIRGDSIREGNYLPLLRKWQKGSEEFFKEEAKK